MNAVLTLLAQSSKFIANHTKNNRSLCHAAISEPTPLEEKNLGKIYIVMELLGDNENAQELFHIIQDTIIYEHYHASSFETEVAFESALQKTNEQIEKWSEGMGEEWIKNFSAVIAVMREDVVHFSSIGKAHAFLTQKDRIINILEQNSTHEKASVLRAFSSILSGKLGKDNALFMCTESILDYISQERLRRLMIENQPSKITDKLSSLLKDNAAGTNFAALVIKMTTENEKNAALKKPAQNKNSYENLEDSMNTLINKERQTNELLSPSLWPSFKKRWKDKEDDEELTSHQEQESPVEEEVQEKALPLDEEKRTPRESSTEEKRYKEYALKTWAITKTLATKIAGLLVLVFQKTIAFFRKKRREQKHWEGVSGIRENIAKFGKDILGRFLHMSRGRKILLVAAIIFIVLFTQSIIFQGKKKETAAQQANYDQSLAAVVQKIDEAKAALLYNNEDSAGKFLKEAQGLITQIPTNAEGYAEKVQPRADEIATKLQAINKVEASSPSIFSDFSKIATAINIARIQKLGENILAFGGEGTGVFLAQPNTDPTTVTKTTSATNTKKPGLIATEAKSGTEVFTLLEKGILEVTDTGKGASETVAFETAAAEKNIRDFAFFGKKIYTLDPQNNQIWKHTAATKGFGKGEAWIEDKNRDLANGVSIFIDGSIYVLESNGKVSKFFNGNKEDFRLTKIDPEITSADKLLGTEDGKNLYVFDKQGKRIVVFTKEGKLVKQITFTGLEDVRDADISSDEKNLYVLAGAQVYTITNTAVTQ